MSLLETRSSTLRKIAVAVAITWAISAFAYIALGRPIIEACYRGESIEVLNQLVARHRALEPTFHDLE
jgi:hypothetical protein